MLKMTFPMCSNFSHFTIILSEKATKFCEISTVDLTITTYIGQIYGEGFAKICGLLRIYELVVWRTYFTFYSSIFLLLFFQIPRKKIEIRILYRCEKSSLWNLRHLIFILFHGWSGSLKDKWFMINIKKTSWKHHPLRKLKFSLNIAFQMQSV